MAARAVTSEAERAPIQPLLEPLLRQCSAEVPSTPQGRLLHSQASQDILFVPSACLLMHSLDLMHVDVVFVSCLGNVPLDATADRAILRPGRLLTMEARGAWRYLFRTSTKMGAR